MTSDDPLGTLNQILASSRDTRGWAMLAPSRICTNCGSEHSLPPTLMRVEGKGKYVRATTQPPPGTSITDVGAPAYYARCERCNGEKPLGDMIRAALAGASNDRDLAQRVGHLLADYFRRVKANGRD